MIQVFLCKADSLSNDSEEVDNATIDISKPLPDIKANSLSDIELFYEKEANSIFEVLKNHLPQGTRHALLRRLLEDSPSYYRGI